MRPATAALMYLTPGLAMATANFAVAAELNEHLWRERVLLVFSPSVDHPDHVRMARELDRRGTDLDERQFVVYRLFSQGASRSDRKPLDAAVVEELRRRYGLTAGQAILILIGKDGGEKLRADLNVADLDAVFRRVDAMPMRRLEMNSR